MIRNPFHKWSKTFKRPLSTSQNKFDMPYKPLREVFLLVYAVANSLLNANTIISIPVMKLGVDGNKFIVTHLYMIAYQTVKI